MSCCTFFGHRDCPEDVVPILRKTIEELIVKCGVDEFFVGDSGNFDRLVYIILLEIENYMYDYELRINKVLAYFPYDLKEFIKNEHLIYPDELDNVPERYAIVHRNDYMLKESEYVVTYTVRSEGGAAKFERKAKRQRKTVINIAELMNK